MAKATRKPPARSREKKSAPPATQWPPFDRLRTEIDRVFEDFGRGTWPTSFFGRSFDAEPF